MFGKLLRGKRSKRQGKQTSSKSKQFTHVGTEERRLILDLRREGHTISGIAEGVSRSTRTVHKVLKSAGMNAVPKNEGVLDPGTENENGKDLRDQFDERLLAGIQGDLVRYAKNAVAENPKFADQILCQILGVKPHKLSKDDLTLELIKDSPEYQERFLEGYFSKLERNGRTEMDILAEGLLLFAKMNEAVNTTNWSKVASDLIASGELRKTFEGLVTALSNARARPAGSQVEQVQETPEAAPTVGSLLRPKGDRPSMEEILRKLSPEQRSELKNISGDGPKMPDASAEATEPAGDPKEGIWRKPPEGSGPVWQNWEDPMV